MELFKDTMFFLNNSSSAYFVGSLISNKTFFLNKTAEEMFGMTVENCDYSKVFDRTETHISEIIAETLKSEKSCIIYDMIVRKKDGSKVLVDLELGFFNEDKNQVYLQMIPQNDSVEKLTLHQVSHSPRAEAILNFDEQLSLFFSNPNFYRIFDATKPSDLDKYSQKLSLAIVEPIREKFQQEILQALEDSEMHYIEAQVTTLSGEKKWIALDLQKRIFEDNEVKILCYATNIDDKKKKEDEISLLNQYLSVVQESTVDILYRVDIEADTMYHYSDFITVGGVKKAIPEYVSVFMAENTIHPEDQDAYLENFKNFYEHDKDPDIPVRFSLSGNPYQWYKITAKKIFDKDGTLKEVFGALINIENEQNQAVELSRLNQFFSATQALDHDVVYRIEMDTMTLHYNKKMPDGSMKEMIYPDYFNDFKNNPIVHPDDREHYVKMTQDLFDGTIEEKDFLCSARFSLVTEEYVWYEIKSKKIYDNEGKCVEIYGKLINIDKERNLLTDNSLVNQYFSAMQAFTPDKLFHIDIKTKTFYHNDTNTEHYGVPLEIPDFLETMVRKKIVHPDMADDFRKDIDSLFSGEKMEYNILALVDDEKYEWFRIKGQFIRNEKGEPVEIFGAMENIQQRIDLEARATHDQLTNVLNKTTFAEVVEQILENRSKSVHHALVIIDMDDFKDVNDTYGHQFGDFVLENFALRIKNCIRDTDIIGRLGGDEFLVFLKGVFDKDMALSRVETMLDRLKPPFANGEFSHKLGASIGIAIIPEDGISYDVLYRNADKAVYESKRLGKNVATLFSEELLGDV